MPVPVYNPQSETINTEPRSGAPTSQTHPQSGNSADNAGSGQTNHPPMSKEEADRLYEERMEDEYAKREGGA